MFFRKASSNSVTGGAAGSGEASSSAEGPQPEVLGNCVSKEEQSAASGSVAERRGTGTYHANLVQERTQSESLVRDGYLMKKGVVNQAYKKRWFVLTTRSLQYYESESTSGDNAKGVIELISISKVDVKGDNCRERFNVFTPTRVYHLKAASVAESEAWIAAITGAAEMERKHHGAWKPRRPSLSPVDSIKLEGASFNPNTMVHTPAELNKYKLWSAFDVAAWVGTFNMRRSAALMYKAGITGSDLNGLSSVDLEKLGIENKQDQLAILKKIGSLVKGEISG
uniref:PH domain-containing protein n=1 Tax=Mucochytrium quahogii TaxID=96639 RepID=A0A7S2RNJ2_9STRA|mmetsp:Transcript_888/g.1421  ORF Transcript_888/g.1421 Transcript_888/m.1421 type:complete len:282 (+) Transcript_888:104-949(+)|eukprot:CAMPEP_0203744678 /NCGR_PEP_ID=MMETSP0098-20131031/665_1 /ASSEMBLY_ACC=CAM_ASM_000208 /TAXON_ID=96639 /ORGANISM=" , Strain NY0313808BC1" /LENGTH=281 /DNA_ID=CAMNT_0050632257 /DNA_START=75 /DNA_END=920 /DNA_ORIENTATION=+